MSTISFTLERYSPSTKSERWLPENLLRLEVATPLEAVVTVIAVIADPKGEHIRVPIVWSPSTGIMRRMHESTWMDLGIEERISHIRNAVQRIARATHKKVVLKYTTIDMFDDQME